MSLLAMKTRSQGLVTAAIDGSMMYRCSKYTDTYSSASKSDKSQIYKDSISNSLPMEKEKIILSREINAYLQNCVFTTSRDTNNCYDIITCELTTLFWPYIFKEMQPKMYGMIKKQMQ